MKGQNNLQALVLLCLLAFLECREYSQCPEDSKLDGCECDNSTSTIVCINKVMPKSIHGGEWRNITLINYPETELSWNNIETDIALVKDSKINSMGCSYCSSFIDITFINIIGNPKIMGYLANENYRLVNMTLIDCAIDGIYSQVLVPSLEHIVIKNNDLEELENIFQKLKILVELDLSNNVIAKLGEGSLTFKTITNLRVNLSNNKIDSNMVKTAQIANLGNGSIYLDLSNNLITNLTSDVFATFASNMSNVYINLANNPITCSWWDNQWTYINEQFAKRHLLNVFCKNYNKYLFDIRDDELKNYATTTSTISTDTSSPSTYATAVPSTTMQETTIYLTTNSIISTTSASKSDLINQAQLLEISVTNKTDFLISINKTAFVDKLNHFKSQVHELLNELAHLNGNLAVEVIERQLSETETAIKLSFDVIDLYIKLLSTAHSIQVRINEALDNLVDTPAGNALKTESMALKDVCTRLDTETDWDKIRAIEIDLAIIEDKVIAIIGPVI